MDERKLYEMKYTNVEDLLSPRIESLLLAAEFISAGDQRQSLASESAQKIVDVFAEGAEVRIGAGTECEDCKPDGIKFESYDVLSRFYYNWQGVLSNELQPANSAGRLRPTALIGLHLH